MKSRPQQTLSGPVSFKGVGIHTGGDVSIAFVPAPVDTGIVFQRVDLPGRPRVQAHVDHVVDTSRCTTIGQGDAIVHTVEHVMSALAAFNIDNLVIEIDGPELPIGDGSAKPFVEMIKSAGCQQQSGDCSPYFLEEPVYYSHGQTYLVALPSPDFRVSYTLHYPDSPVIGSQYCSFTLSSEVFELELSSCRTFARYEEIGPLMEAGLIKGGSIDNAVVIKGSEVMCSGGLRFADEMCRHKVLDLIGDLSLVARDVKAHIIAACSGHSANVQLAKKLSRRICHERR